MAKKEEKDKTWEDKKLLINKKASVPHPGKKGERLTTRQMRFPTKMVKQYRPDKFFGGIHKKVNAFLVNRRNNIGRISTLKTFRLGSFRGIFMRYYNKKKGKYVERSWLHKPSSGSVRSAK